MTTPGIAAAQADFEAFVKEGLAIMTTPDKLTPAAVVGMSAPSMVVAMLNEGPSPLTDVPAVPTAMLCCQLPLGTMLYTQATIDAEVAAAVAAKRASHERALSVALADARMVERERCAKVCDDVHSKHVAEHGSYIGDTYATECAQAIRKSWHHEQQRTDP